MSSRFDVTASEYGAPDEFWADCVPAWGRAVQAAIDHGGGTLLIPDRVQGWRPQSTFRIHGARNLEIVGPHAPLVVDHLSWPVVRIEGANEVQITGLRLALNQSPVVLDAAGAEQYVCRSIGGDDEYAPMIGVEESGNIYLERIVAQSCVQGVTVGLPWQQAGARRLVVTNCELGYATRGLTVWGASYLVVDGRRSHWQDMRGVGTAVYLGAPGGIDGADIAELFIEHANVGVRLVGNVANLAIRGLRLDRVKTAGVWASPADGASVNQLDVQTSRLNCLDGAYPILLEGTGAVGGVHVDRTVVVDGGIRPVVAIGNDLRGGGRLGDVWYGGRRIA